MFFGPCDKKCMGVYIIGWLDSCSLFLASAFPYIGFVSRLPFVANSKFHPVTSQAPHVQSFFFQMVPTKVSELTLIGSEWVTDPSIPSRCACCWPDLGHVLTSTIKVGQPHWTC